MITLRTEGKRSEEALRAASAYARNLIEASLDPLVTISAEGKITDVNEASVRVTGVPSAQLIGTDFSACFTEPEKARESYRRVFSEGFVRDYPLAIRHVSGRVTDVLFNAAVYRDEQGRTLGVLATARDITERKRSEEALKASEKRFRDIADNAQEWIWEVDAEGKYTYASQVVEKILGYTPEEILQKHFYDLFHPEDREALKAAALAAFAAKQPFWEFINRNVHKNGQTIWLATSGLPLLDDKGNLLGYRGADTDITERKRSEAEREKLQAQLIQARKMELVGQLAGGVAHDFNNILTVILGNADNALARLTEQDPMHKRMREIKSAAERSANLTRQLLAFARKQTIDPKVLDLNDTVLGMLEMLRWLIGEDIDLVWLPGHDLWKVRVDPSQMDQILANLSVNARDAIKGVGKVTIETANRVLDDAFCAEHAGSVPGEYVLLALSDTGVGMSNEVLKHVFEPFFTTKGLGRGTGLGLATVYGIVKQNEGFINARSEPGAGTTLEIYLPRYVGEEAETSGMPAVAQSMTG
ncbi:MAG: PAS domain S-box protein [Candidatus Eisenbacteria bacterium]|nr:PAS domain S-box protein [Candidatus Eisenbacteria bacterium]